MKNTQPPTKTQDWEKKIKSLIYEYATNWEDWDCLFDRLVPVVRAIITSAVIKAKREAVEECIKALPKHLNTTDHRTGDDIEQNIGFNGCVDDANVALQSLLDQSLKAMSELSNNKSK